MQNLDEHFLFNLHWNFLQSLPSNSIKTKTPLYIALNAWDRSVHSTRERKCDDNLKTGWYRFQDQAGRQLPTICPPVHRCNTDLTGWMNGNHPNVEDGIVKRQVCFHGYSNCCHRTTTIDVRNCGAYFVYRLTKVSNCMSRYCGTG